MIRLRMTTVAGRAVPKYTLHVLVGLAAVAAVLALVFKPSVQTALRSGDTISAEFTENGELHPDESKVKLDDLPVGVVSGVGRTDHGTVIVSMKIDDGIRQKLGTAPTARIEPNTILGGIYSINLQRGGADGPFADKVIPAARTATPVELDRVLEGLPQSARTGLDHTVANLDATLAQGGGGALDDVLRDAPPTMRTGAGVLAAARGTRPDVDLSDLVSDLDSTAQALDQSSGQLGSIVDSLDTTTAMLARQRAPLAHSIATLPQTLGATRSGLSALGASLDRLTVTAPSFRPAAQQLNPLLAKANPVLEQARPLVTDLRPLLADARPLVQQLVPASQQATNVLNDVRGPVLDRVDGPITHDVLSPWHGTGAYEGGGRAAQADHTFYQELGYLVARFDNLSKSFDNNGNFVNFHLGVGSTSLLLGGTPLNLPQMLQNLLALQSGGTR